MVRWAVLFLFFSPLLAAAPTEDLYLQAYLDTKENWYPGQEYTVVYRIWYKGQIALIKEELPLLDIPGLEKVGGKVFYITESPPYSIQEITQKYRAKNAGQFTAPASYLEGVHYVIEEGAQVPIPPKLTAKTPPYTITVNPFPTKDQPLDFNGSIGTGTFTFHPPKEKKTRVGDWITFSIVAQNFGPNSVLIPPNLNCQPGFAGFFKQPPGLTVVKSDPVTNTKTFEFKITAENSLPDAMPPIHWTTFDPEKETYHTFKTPAVTLTILPTPLQNPFPPLQLPPVVQSQKLEPLPLPTTTQGESFESWVDRSWVGFQLALFLLYLALIFLRRPLKRWRLLYHLNPWRRAKRAMDRQTDPLEVAGTMHSLLSQKMKAKGPNAAVIEFLKQLDQFRFAKGAPLTKSQILSKGRQLYLLLSLLLVTCSLSAETGLEKGNLATTWIEREREWNAALTDLLNAPPSRENQLALAFLCEQFNQKPLALFYLEKASVDTPDAKLDAHIAALEKELGVMHVPPSLFTFSKPFFIFATFLLVFFAFYLYAIRKRRFSLYVFGCTYAWIALYFIVQLFISKSAVILEPTFLYRDAALKEKAVPFPLVPGDSVEVVALSNDTFEVYSYPLETYGYLLQTSLRPID